MAISLYSALDGLEFAEGLSETDPPFLANQVPAPSGTSIPINTGIDFTVDDLDAGVLSGTIVISVNSGMGFTNIWSGSMFQTGFTGSIAASGFGWDFIIDPDNNFPNSQLISVRVQADDADGNSLDTTYSFTTIEGVAVESPFLLKKVYPYSHKNKRLEEGIDRQRYVRIYPLLKRFVRITGSI